MLVNVLQKFSHSSYCFPILQKCLYSLTTHYEKHADVVIVGGGIMGYSTAYWLKKKCRKLDVMIIEKDTSYKQASTVLSVGGLRQQFSVPENIQMSLFCGHVFANINDYFSTGTTEAIDIQFVNRGYLVLCKKESQDILRLNFETQRKFGASVEFLTRDQIQKRWSWMNTDDIECGVLGTANEGWFDPWLLLSCIRQTVHQFGVTCINGSLIEFLGTNKKLSGAKIQLVKGREIEIKCSNVVNATGSWAGETAALAEIGTGLSGSDYPLFVEKRKRYVYNVMVPGFPCSILTPMVIDSTGTYFRKETSGMFICGLSPEEENEPSTDNLDIDFEWFDEYIWPQLANRVPTMDTLKVKSAWAGFYDYNTKDQNLIIGKHPKIENFFLCNGSSGHGIQHSMAIGRAVTELILHGNYQTIDLSRLHYDRFLKNELIFENNIF